MLPTPPWCFFLMDVWKNSPDTFVKTTLSPAQYNKVHVRECARACESVRHQLPAYTEQETIDTSHRSVLSAAKFAVKKPSTCFTSFYHCQRTCNDATPHDGQFRLILLPVASVDDDVYVSNTLFMSVNSALARGENPFATAFACPTSSCAMRPLPVVAVLTGVTRSCNAAH